MKSNGKKSKIVMVDDDSEDVFFVRKALSSASDDIVFDAVDSGIRFLETLNKSDSPKPDLILLDINMPRMNGYDVLAALKEESQWENLPVIMLTTSSSEIDRQKSLDLGAAAFVTKPQSQAEISAFILRVEQCLPDMGRNNTT